jgi:hypothetical protein
MCVKNSYDITQNFSKCGKTEMERQGNCVFYQRLFSEVSGIVAASVHVEESCTMEPKAKPEYLKRFFSLNKHR